MAVTRRNAAVLWTFDHDGVLLHQGIGLEAFNAMPMRRAVHAVFECCYSVPLAADLARERPFATHDELFRCADSLLFGLSEESIDSILQAYPDVGRRPGSEKSQAEQCAITDERPEVMAGLAAASKAYLEHFGFGFVMFVNGYCAARRAGDDARPAAQRLRDRAQDRAQRAGQDQPHPPGTHARPRRRLRQLVSGNR